VLSLSDIECFKFLKTILTMKNKFVLILMNGYCHQGQKQVRNRSIDSTGG
jgi:hypothetical protein